MVITKISKISVRTGGLLSVPLVSALVGLAAAGALANSNVTCAIVPGGVLPGR